MSNGFPSLMALIKSQGASKKVVAVLPIGGGIGITIGPLLTTFLMNDDGKLRIKSSIYMFKFLKMLVFFRRKVLSV